MIEAVIAWSMRNRFMVVLVTIFVILGGVLAMQGTPLDAIPDLSTCRSLSTPNTPARRRAWSRTRSPIR